MSLMYELLHCILESGVGAPRCLHYINSNISYNLTYCKHVSGPPILCNTIKHCMEDFGLMNELCWVSNVNQNFGCNPIVLRLN